MESRVSSQVTTVSQSEQLLAAGIPADRASMFWVRKVVEVDVNGDELWGCMGVESHAAFGGAFSPHNGDSTSVYSS